jgi:hypothetical protein
VEVFILLFFVVLCCLAVLSVSASGRRSLLHRRSTEQSLPRFIELQYDGMLGGRLKRIGNMEIRYDMFDDRPKCLGEIELQYDGMLGGRLKRIGNMEIRYGMFDDRPRCLGCMEIQYEIFGGRPKIVSMSNDANLTQQHLVTIFFVFYERTKKIKAASRQMKRRTR